MATELYAERSKMPEICKWKFFERLEYKKRKIHAAGKKDAGGDEKLLIFLLGLSYQFIKPYSIVLFFKSMSKYRSLLVR
jgi:hypothetical protein